MNIYYIAGMMDQFAIKEYEKYFSMNFESISLKEIQNIEGKIQDDQKFQIALFNQRLRLSGKNAIIEMSKSVLSLKKANENL